MLFYGFTAVRDWLSILVAKCLAWFWLYDTRLKTALNSFIKKQGYKQARALSALQ